MVTGALLAVSLGSSAAAQAPDVKVLGWGFSSPTALVASGQDLFVAEPVANTVVELDAQSGALVRVLSGHFDGPDALAVAGPDLFVADEGNRLGFFPGGTSQAPQESLDEVDIATGAVVKVFSGVGFDQPDALLADGADLFVANVASNSLTELDIGTGAVLRELSGPTYGFDHPAALALVRPHLFVASNDNGATGSLTELDAATGSVQRRLAGASFRFSGPSAMAVSGDKLFVAAGGGFAPGALSELSIPTGAQVWSVPITGGTPVRLLADGERLFVAGYGTAAPLSELNATTGKLIKAFAAGPYGLSLPTAMAMVGQELWVADAATNHVIAVQASTGALVQSLWGSPYRFQDPIAMAVSGGNLFVANQEGDCLTELSTSTGALIRVISSPRFRLGVPTSLAVAGPDLVVANNGHLAGPNGSLTVIDAATGALVRVIVGHGLISAGDLVSVGDNVFVAHAFQIPGSVTELNPATGQVLRTLDGSAYGFGDIMAMVVSGTDLFVANVGPVTTASRVSEVNLASGGPARTLLSSPFSAGSPEYMVVSGRDLFVSYRGASSDSGSFASTANRGALTEVNIASGKAKVISGSTNHVAFGGPMAVYGRDLYVANTDGTSVAELDTATGALVRVLSGSAYGFAAADALAVAGGKLFVANGSNESVTELPA